MQSVIGIRREDKNKWERRVPLVPADVARLAKEHGIEFMVQPSANRAFPDDEYEQAGGQVQEDLSVCPVVLAVKEIPSSFLQKERTYMFFSHTIKGQKKNMPLLRKIMDLGCTLIDYEKVTDDQGRRLIFFGRHAGLAGMIDSLWGLGRRLQEAEGLWTPFLELQPAHRYASLAEAKASVAKAGRALAEKGVPEALRPFVCGFSGYGHVSQGAQEVYDELPVQEVTPEELLAGLPPAADKVFKVVFREEHMVEPAQGQAFDLQEYYHHPERYRGRFQEYAPHLTMLMNCIYWEKRYPRLLPKDLLAEMWGADESPKLRFVGDVSCDPEGAVEATVACTTPDDPIFVYDPVERKAQPGFAGRGLAVLAVDNLPAELPRESSEAFSKALEPFVPALAEADMNRPLADTGLPPELQRAVIVHRGELTEAFRYLEEFVGSADE